MASLPYLNTVRMSEATDPPWSFVHFKLMGYNRVTPYGASLLLPCRRLYRRLRLCEDNLVLYRLKRSPDRFVFSIKGLQSLSPEDRALAMRKIRQEIRKKIEIDKSTGSIKTEIDPIGIEEDLIVDSEAIDVSRLNGSQQVNYVLDIDYLRKRFLGVVGIPPDYLGFSDSPGSFASDIPLTFQDVNFARKIKRLQAGIMEGVAEIFMIHLCWLGIDPFSEQAKFTVKMNFVSAIDEKQRLEVDKIRAETISILKELGKELNLDPIEWQEYLLKRSHIPTSFLLRKGEISKIIKGKVTVKEDRLNEIAEILESNEPAKTILERTIEDVRVPTVHGVNSFSSQLVDLQEYSLPMEYNEENKMVLSEAKINQWRATTIKKPSIQRNIMEEVTKAIKEGKLEENQNG